MQLCEDAGELLRSARVGLYANTPLEAVLDDDPRRDSLIFSVNVWQQTGHEQARRN